MAYAAILRIGSRAGVTGGNSPLTDGVGREKSQIPDTVAPAKRGEVDRPVAPAHGRVTPVRPRHSHSIVPGGLLVMSSTTRLTSGTSLVIRVEIRVSTSYGSRDQSAVIASSLETGRSTTGCP